MTTPTAPQGRTSADPTAGSGDTAGPATSPGTVPARLTVYADGPYVLTGEVEIRDGQGRLVKTLTKVALCRCGQSGTKPYCDGSHKRCGFTDPGPIMDIVEETA